MYFSRIFVGTLLLLSMVAMSPIVYASDGQTSSYPLAQLSNGSSTQNITCSSDLKLIYKSTNGYPACVKPRTAENLIKRGWGTTHPINYLVKISGFLVNYNITEGNIQGGHLGTPSYLLYISVKMIKGGVLNITLPRALIDAKCGTRCLPPYNSTDEHFAYLLNNAVQGDTAKEIRTTPINRTLSIQVPSNTTQILLTYFVLL